MNFDNKKYGRLYIIGNKNKIKIIIKYLEESKIKTINFIFTIKGDIKEDVNKIGKFIKEHNDIKWHIKIKGYKYTYILMIKERIKVGLVTRSITNIIKEVHNGCRRKKKPRK